VARLFIEDIRRIIDESGVASDDHFGVDGTQLDAWASLVSLQVKDEEGSEKRDDDPGNPTVDFEGEKRRNDTHQFRTDPDSRLYRKGKGKEAKLSYMGNGADRQSERSGVTRGGAPSDWDRRTGSRTDHAGGGKAMAAGPGEAVYAQRIVALLRDCARGMSLRIMRCGKTGNRRWMSAPPAMRVMPSASASGNAWRKGSNGGRASGCIGNFGTMVWGW